MTSFSHDMMTRGRGGVWIPPKNDDVIYEQPPTAMTSGQQNFATFFMLASLALGASNTNSLFWVVLAKKPKKIP